MNKLNHLAIIVDGNGRWAKERNQIRSYGHLKGSQNLKKITNYINDNLKEIKVLSLFVFSTENFNRSKEEVDYLMNLFRTMFKKDKNEYKRKNMKVLFSGRKTNLEKDIIKIINDLEEETKNNTGLIVNFCLNYGGRSEIVDATLKIINDLNNNKIKLQDINETSYSKYLYKELPDIDLLIRTSGEQRISNFMLWSLSYSELYFTKTYFPDFTKKELKEIIDNYQTRQRRFGKN